MNRMRLLILVALIVVVLGIAAAFLLVGGTSEDATPAPPVNTLAPGEPTREPQAQSEPTLPPQPTQSLVSAVIVVQNIGRGQEIPLDALQIRAWPEEALAFDAVPIGDHDGDPDTPDITLLDYEGAIARTELVPEQPLLNGYLAPSRADLAERGSDLSTIIPEGRVAISVPVDRLTSVSYGIQPGDNVDILVSLLYVDIDEEFQSILPNQINIVNVETDDSGSYTLNVGANVNGRFDSINVPVFANNSASSRQFPVIEQPAEDPRPRLVVQRTIQNAEVLFIGDFPADGVLFKSEPTPTAGVISVDDTTNAQAGEGDGQVDTNLTIVIRPNIVTLAVTPQESLIITWLIEARVPLTFAMRSATDNSRVITDSVTLEYIMENYEITVPPSRNYSIEPAITSIRQLLTGDIVTFGSPSASIGQE